MATFTLDFTDLKTPVWQFPNGPYEATIKEAKTDIAQSGNAKLMLTMEVYHPDFGTGTLYDTIPSKGFAAKGAAFWMAINDFVMDDLTANPVVNIQPADLVNAQFIVHLGEQERKDKPGVMRKSVVAPWYTSLSKGVHLLNDETPL